MLRISKYISEVNTYESKSSAVFGNQLPATRSRQIVGDLRILKEQQGIAAN